MKLRELKCAEDLNCEFEHSGLKLWKQIIEKKLNKILLIYLISFYRSWRYDDTDSDSDKIKRTKIGPVEIRYESWKVPYTTAISHAISVQIDEIVERIAIHLVIKGNQRKCLIVVGKRNESYLPKTKL